MSRSVYVAQTLQELSDVARELAPHLYGKVVYLSGDVGAGKTTFVSALAPFLGYGGAVSSPTFTLVNEYHPSSATPATPSSSATSATPATPSASSPLPIYHADFYRLSSIQQVENIGFWDLVDNGATILVEWAESVLLETFLPPDCTIRLTRSEGIGQASSQGLPTSSSPVFVGDTGDNVSSFATKLEVVFHDESSI